MPRSRFAQAGNQAGTPVVVSCEPHQRTLVRPAVVNGVTVSQVECVAAEGVVATTAQPQAFAPVSYQQAAPRRGRAAAGLLRASLMRRWCR